MSSKPTIFQSYFGSKNGSGVVQRIINQIRPHDVYLELFAGGGIVARTKKPASKNIVNDLSWDVSQEWDRLNLPGFWVGNFEATDLLRRFEFDPALHYCIYLDPPYPLDSRRNARPVYEHEMMDDQHVELLRIVKALPGHIDVLISTYPNELYARELSGWRVVKFKSMTHAGPATELLYLNYNNPTGELHQYDFLGKDFTDRQRIKRKLARKVEQLKRLPAAERNAIIEALSAVKVGNVFAGVKSETPMVATPESSVYGRPEIELSIIDEYPGP